MNMKYSGPYANEDLAVNQSEAAMRALCRKRGVPYPLPPGPHVGTPRIADESIAFATHAVEVREANNGQFWCALTEEIEGLEDVSESVEDGTRHRIRRSGAVKPNSDFKARVVQKRLGRNERRRA